jgi:hypothetical protein
VPALRRHLDRQGFPMVKIAKTREEMFHATRIDPEDPWVQWAMASLARTSGKKPALLPNLGGSLPNDIFTDVLGLRTVWVPHSYPGCSQHAPNEHLPPEVLREALSVMTGLYWDLGAGDTPKQASYAARRDDQLADVASYRTTDQRVIAQDPGRVDDGVRRPLGGAGIMVGEEVEKTLEVDQRARGKSNARHALCTAPRGACPDRHLARGLGRSTRQRLRARSRRLSGRTRVQVRGDVFRGVKGSARVHVRRRRLGVANERLPRFGQIGLTLEGLDHPGVRRLPRCVSERRDALLQLVR